MFRYLFFLFFNKNSPKENGYYKDLQIRAHNLNLSFLFLNQNIFCGYSKEPSQWDGSFEHPKLMFEQMDKIIITILG